MNINDFGGYPSAGTLWAEIKISGTSVDCTLYYGDEDAQLDAGAGIYPGSKIPGEGGTILVAGHTATFFRDFEHAQNAAQITVTSRLRYLHLRNHRYAGCDRHRHFSLRPRRGGGKHILYTCYPLGQTALTDLRYFIYGRFVSGPALEGLS